MIRFIEKTRIEPALRETAEKNREALAVAIQRSLYFGT